MWGLQTTARTLAAAAENLEQVADQVRAQTAEQIATRVRGAGATTTTAAAAAAAAPKAADYAHNLHAEDLESVAERVRSSLNLGQTDHVDHDDVGVVGITADVALARAVELFERLDKPGFYKDNAMNRKLGRAGQRKKSACPRAGSSAPKRVVNLSAGPATLDDAAMRTAANNFLDHKGSGMSMMEMSHRDPGGPVQTAIQSATNSVRDLLEVPDEYHVLWMAGGAHAQFAATILNCLGDKGSVDVVETGYWSERFRVSEAERFCDVNVAWSGEPSGFTRHAAVEDWTVSPDSAFVHVCLNETVQGVEFHDDPKLPGTPGDGSPFLVCDATSTLMSRPMDIENYGVVFGKIKTRTPSPTHLHSGCAGGRLPLPLQHIS